MTAKEVKNIIEKTLANLPERMSGNEANHIVLDKLKNMIVADRENIVEALKSYLAFRISSEQRNTEDAMLEARIWMALDLAEGLSLIELCPAIEILVTDVRNGKVFLPVHEKSVEKYLQRLRRVDIKH